MTTPINPEILNKVQATDPDIYLKLMEMQENRPGMFAKILQTALWSLVGAGIGKITLDDPEKGALAGALVKMFLLFRDEKARANQMVSMIQPFMIQSPTPIQPIAKNIISTKIEGI